jgi:hypothetical protein
VDERGGVGCGAARRGRGPGLRICAAAADVPCTWLVLREHGPKDFLALDRLPIHPAYDIAPAPSMSAASISRVYGREESVVNMMLSILSMIIQNGMRFFPRFRAAVTHFAHISRELLPCIESWLYLWIPAVCAGPPGSRWSILAS